MSFCHVPHPDTRPLDLSHLAPYRLLASVVLALCLAVPVLAQDSEEEEDKFQLARNLLTKSGDSATAAHLFAEFIRNYPGSEYLAEARLLLAQSYRDSELWDLAARAYETFYQEHPEHLKAAEARRGRAECLTREGRHREAGGAYEEIQKLFPASRFAGQALLDAGANYSRAGDPQQAERTYRRLIADYAEHRLVHQARYRLAVLRFAAGFPDAAQQLLADITAAQPPADEAPSALLLAGQIELFLGRLEEAARAFGRLHRRYPKSAQADSAYLEAASHLYDHLQFSQAGDAFQAAVARIRDPQLKLRARIGLADAHLHSGRNRSALEHYQALLSDLPAEDAQRGRVGLGLAIARGREGEFTAAVNLFQQIIRSAPGTPEGMASFRELGALYRSRGDYARAVTWYRNYLEVAPDAPDRDPVKVTLAGVYAAAGYHEDAIALYRQMAEGASPLAAQAQFGLARAFEAGGEPRRARREYMAFLERYPARAESRHARDRVEYLSEFAVLDRDGLSRVHRQAQIDELGGTPRQRVTLDLAEALYALHDIPNAVRLFEAYAGRFPDAADGPRAQYSLAEGLLKLARQRRLEGRPEESDSLRQLGLQEYRILARAESGEWSHRAALQLVETQGLAAPDSSRHQVLEQGFAEFVAEHPESPQLDAALLGLADAQRQQAAGDPAKLDQAAATYDGLRARFPESAYSAQALYGLALCRAKQGAPGAAIDSLARVLRDHPGAPISPQVLYELGLLLFQQGELLDAMARFQELLLAYPAFPERSAAQRHLAETHHRLGQYDRAIALYRRLLEDWKAEDRDGRIRRRLAEAYQQRGDLETALDAYRRIPDERPGAAGLDSILVSQADLLVQLGRKQEAVDLFLRVRDGFGSSPLATAAARRAGHLLADLEQYKRAYAVYQPLLATTEDAETFGRAVVALFRLRRLEEGRKAASAFSKRFADDAPWIPRFRLEEGRCYLGQKQYDKALKKFRQVEEQAGEWADDGAHYAALALWQQNMDAPSEEGGARALQAQTNFLATYPDSPYAAQVHLRLGDYYYQVGQFLRAAGAYKGVLEGSAEQAPRELAIWRLVESYRKANQFEDAHRMALRLLREFPDHPHAGDTQLEVALILQDKGQYAQAIAQLDRVLEWAEGNNAAQALYYKGLSYWNMGEYRRAIEHLYQVTYYGADASAQFINTADYRRAECHETLEEYDTAIRVFEQIVRREGAQSDLGALAKRRVDALRQRVDPR